MVNLKSLFAILAFVALLIVAIGLVRFAVDVWSHFHASSSGSAVSLTSQIDLRGLGIALGGFLVFAVSVLFFWLRKH